jgi:hypothetical protein
MPLRVLEYVVMIYKRQLRDWEREHHSLDYLRLQPVLPVVLYTGTRTWDKLSPIRDLVELGEELPERIPAIQPLFLNVGRATRQELEKGGPFGVLLRLIQQRRTRLPVFEETLREAVRAIEALAEEDRQRWLELLSYIDALLYYEREPAEQQPLRQTVIDTVQNDRHRQEVYDMGKTMAEHLKEEGREEGRQQGAVQARREVLLDLLRHKFRKVPARLVERIQTTDRLADLKVWYAQALDAKTLEDLPFAAAD